MRWSLIVLTMAGPAAADGCDDLWFTRNLIMDRAGYCFGSTLGQAVFDNSDCIGKSVQVAPIDSQLVARIQNLEKVHGCRVNTSGTHLDLPDSFVRRQLIDLPVRDEFESACLGWLGQVVPLRSGTSTLAPVIGQILPGQTVSYGHYPVGNWSYVTVSNRGAWQPVGGGWLDLGTYGEQCEQVAG